jgi:hypothetical protein
VTEKVNETKCSERANVVYCGKGTVEFCLFASLLGGSVLPFKSGMESQSNRMWVGLKRERERERDRDQPSTC